MFCWNTKFLHWLKRIFCARLNFETLEDIHIESEQQNKDTVLIKKDNRVIKFNSWKYFYFYTLLFSSSRVAEMSRSFRHYRRYQPPDLFSYFYLTGDGKKIPFYEIFFSLVDLSFSNELSGTRILQDRQDKIWTILTASLTKYNGFLLNVRSIENRCPITITFGKIWLKALKNPAGIAQQVWSYQYQIQALGTEMIKWSTSSFIFKHSA